MLSDGMSCLAPHPRFKGEGRPGNVPGLIQGMTSRPGLDGNVWKVVLDCCAMRGKTVRQSPELEWEGFLPHPCLILASLLMPKAAVEQVGASLLPHAGGSALLSSEIRPP